MKSVAGNSALTKELKPPAAMVLDPPRGEGRITQFFVHISQDEWRAKEIEKHQQQMQDVVVLQEVLADAERMAAQAKLATTHQRNNARKSWEWEKKWSREIDKGVQNEDGKKVKKKKVRTLNT